jgi:hypothetical protein
MPWGFWKTQSSGFLDWNLHISPQKDLHVIRENIGIGASYLNKPMRKGLEFSCRVRAWEY